MVALLDHLELGIADLVGFSMGAGVALRVAMGHPARVRRLVLGGIGDAAVNAHHDPEQVARIAAAFESGMDKSTDPLALRIRRNAELAGNEPRALLPFLRGGGWPGGLDELLPISAPVLLFVAENDEYMGRTETIQRWLADAEIVVAPCRGHHDVLLDEELRAQVIRFLA